MKESTKKEIIKPTFVLFAICLVVTALLALTNSATKKAIDVQQAKDAQTSRQMALSEANSFVKSDKAADCYVGKKDGKSVGWVFTTKTTSYGGDITVMTGINNTGKVSGVVLVSTSDTPGLGLNAQKESFRAQYKQQVPENGFTVVKGGGAGKGQVNALTGATITSKAVTKAVNEAVTEYQKVKGGE
jgi:electron transport complex protein RnfG